MGEKKEGLRVISLFFLLDFPRLTPRVGCPIRDAPKVGGRGRGTEASSLMP